MNGRVERSPKLRTSEALATGEEGWVVGDRVLHVMEQDGSQGTIREVEDKRILVSVEWDTGGQTYEWSNMLVRVGDSQ